MELPGFPGPLEWRIAPAAWSFDGGELLVQAPRRTDLFRDPRGEVRIDNSPRALVEAEAPFLFSARLRVEFASDFDAGVLLLYAGEGRWAKLCFEYSPQHEPMVVSVVTDGTSDDCNHVVWPEGPVYLRIAGLGNGAYAFHYSADGKRWHLARYFRLDAPNAPLLGLSAQSPLGEGCRVRFSEIRYEKRLLQDLRGGE